jgi:methyltransferase (TIGR00027 family)
LQVIEVDHPATQALKQQALNLAGAGGVDSARSLLPHYVALDLVQQDLASALAACAGFDASRYTLFIIEGVLMYLNEAKVGNLLRQLQAIAPQNRLAFTWFDTAAGFEVQSRWLTRWLALRNEPFLSGMPRAILPRFLARHGYECLDVGESAAQLALDEAVRLSRHGRVLRGEYICLAQSGHCAA